MSDKAMSLTQMLGNTRVQHQIKEAMDIILVLWHYKIASELKLRIEILESGSGTELRERQTAKIISHYLSAGYLPFLYPALSVLYSQSCGSAEQLTLALYLALWIPSTEL